MAIEYFGGPRTLNGLTGASQTFAVASSGTDFSVASSGSVHTLNLPDASAAARGVVTTGTQTIAGNKTFSGAISASNLSGTNTGDNATNSLYSGLVSNATHTGDATGSTALTLATVNSNVGTYGSATQASQVTVNAKGLVTAASGVTVTPAVGSITGLGTSVATALGVAVGSAGSFLVNGGALGTPSSGIATNLTGTASGLTAGNVTTNANLTGDVTSIGNTTTIAAAAVSLAKMANMATASLIYRKTAGTGAPEVQTLATLKTDLGLTGTNSGDQDLSAYLPLAGGTLTGPITGSSNVIEQRNSTNAQELRIYNTYTSATSYERIEIKGKASANFEIGPENGSTGGTLRGLTIGGYSAGSATIAPWMSFTGSTGELGIFGNGTVRQNKYSDDTAAAVYTFRKYRGTEALPTALNAGDTIGQIFFQGYHGAAIGTSASITAFASDAFTASPVNRPTRMYFNTTGPGDTVSSPRMTISDSGDVGIGTTTVSARTHVVSTTEQLRIGFDAGDYFSTTVGSTGGVTFNAVGSAPSFTFSDAVTCGTTLAVTGATTFNSTVVAESAPVFLRTSSLYFDSYGTHNGIRNRRANGTLALPTQVISGDLLGFWNALGYHDGGAFHATAAGGIYMYASENFTSTAHGGNLRFLTTQIGSTTLTNRVIIADNGNVGIGANFTTPQKLLELSAADSATIRISSTDTTASVGQLVGAVEFYGSDATAPGARVVADIKCAYVLDTGASELQFSTNYGGVPAEIGARLSKDGYWGVGTELTINSITSPLDIAGNCLRVRTQRTPSSAAAGGNAGEWCNDANYIYICTASNTWKRVAIATW